MLIYVQSVMLNKKLIKKNNIKTISDSISSKDLRNITSNLDNLVTNLNSITLSLKNSEGTAGQLINDNSIYINLENATKELNILIEDIKLKLSSK